MDSKQIAEAMRLKLPVRYNGITYQQITEYILWYDAAGTRRTSVSLLDKNSHSIPSSQTCAIMEQKEPDDERQTISVAVQAKATLAPTNPVATALCITSDGNGEMVVAEMVPQIPGQINMDGTQQEAPKILKLVQTAN